MRLRDTFLMCGVAVSLGLAVTLVITSVGTHETTRQLPREPLASAAAGELRGVVEAPGMSVAEGAVVARTRTASASEESGISPLDAERRRDGRRREAEYLAAFLALRKEQGSDAFERALRDALDGKHEPQCRKVAALRALHSAAVPGTDAVLAAAVQDQADVSDGSSLSVPRYALKLLFERAPSGEDARRALARLAFVPNARISDDLCRQASTALAGSIHGPRHDEAERLLRLETPAAQLDAALEALTRDVNFGAAQSSLAAPAR